MRGERLAGSNREQFIHRERGQSNESICVVGTSRDESTQAIVTSQTIEEQHGTLNF